MKCVDWKLKDFKTDFEEFNNFCIGFSDDDDMKCSFGRYLITKYSSDLKNNKEVVYAKRAKRTGDNDGNKKQIYKKNNF